MKPSTSSAQQRARVEKIEKRFFATADKLQDPDAIRVDSEQEKISKLFGKDSTFVKLPIALIEVDQNVRSSIDSQSPEFLALVETIRVNGVLQPPIVTVTVDSAGRYHLTCVAGHRRLLACKIAGLPETNCFLKVFESAALQTIASVSENLSRKDLDPMDLADAFLKLETEGYTRSQMEELFDRNKTTVLRYLKMARWPLDVKELIRQKEEKFSKRVLLDLASRSANDEEIRAKVQEIAGVSLQPIGNRVSKSAKIKAKLESFFEEKKLSESEIGLILETLHFLKFKL